MEVFFDKELAIVFQKTMDFDQKLLTDLQSVIFQQQKKSLKLLN